MCCLAFRLLQFPRLKTLPYVTKDTLRWQRSHHFASTKQIIVKYGSPASSHPTQPDVEVCLLVSKLRMLHHIYRHVSQGLNYLEVLAPHRNGQLHVIIFTLTVGVTKVDSLTEHPTPTRIMCTRRSTSGALLLKCTSWSPAGNRAACSTAA